MMDSIRFSDFTMHRKTRRLCRGEEDIPIGGRAYDLLELLIEQRDRVVGRDEIMAHVWPGTVVGDNNLNVQVANLRRILGPEAIVTVPSRGLRFALEIANGTATPLSLPDRPSVVVLPFTNLGGDADLDWLADGFVEDITTELSRFRDLFVVARNSAYAYRQMPRALPVISQELGVRYVVEGSVRATADRVRVTAQLVDAANGGQVWAETFDRDLAGHFDTQTMVARAIVSCLAPQIDRAEAARISIAQPEDLTAHGLAMQAWSVVSTAQMSPEFGLRDKARNLARQALARNESSALAWRVLAWVAWWDAYYGASGSVEKSLRDGFDTSKRAIAADPTDHHARRVQALLHFVDKDYQSGMTVLRNAHEMNPNCAITLGWLGVCEAHYGDAEAGLPLIEAALRRSPRDPSRGVMQSMLGFCNVVLGNYAAARSAADASLSESTESASALLLSTLARVGLGDYDGARDAFYKLEKVAPALIDARLAGHWLTSNDEYRKRAQHYLHVAAGLALPKSVGERR